MLPFDVPGDRQVFTAIITPERGDFDENGHVNNVVYLRWVQEMATAHWRSRAPAEAQHDWGWIVLRHEIDYRRPLLPDEKATARTWVGECRGPRFDRFVRIDGPDGEMSAQTRSEWVLIDSHSRKPSRVPGWMQTMFA